MRTPVRLTLKRTITVEIELRHAETISSAKRWAMLQDLQDLHTDRGNIVLDTTKLTKVERIK